MNMFVVLFDFSRRKFLTEIFFFLFSILDSRNKLS